MTFKQIVVKTAQALLGLVFLGLITAFAGLLVKTVYRLFMYGFNVW